MDTAFDRARQLARDGKLEQAEAALRRLVSKPGAATSVLVELARVLRLRGAGAAAEQFMEMASARAKDASSWHEIGTAFDSLGKHDRAIEAFTRATHARPKDAASWNGLGLSLIHANRIDEAIVAMERARDESPRDATILCNLAWAWSLGWRGDEALNLVRAVSQEHPEDVEARKLLVFLMNYSDAPTPKDVLAAHVPFGKAYDAIAGQVGLGPVQRAKAVLDGSRAVRVGLLSPDFRDHPVARFVEPLLEGRDRSSMEVRCYSISIHSDATTARLRSLADGWTDLGPVREVEAVRRIRADDLDVLVDLNGHTAGGRPGILALRGARVQATYLGYPNTTGLAAMDARLVDEITDPPGSESLATERLVRLSPCFACYGPTKVAREVPPHGAAIEGAAITFGSFNTLRKLTPRMLGVWCEILRRVPGSRLLLKNAGVGSSGVGRRVLAEAERCGIDPSRIELVGRLADEREHYLAYHRMDIALDTVPYNGTTTTCDALWMGVPVVTLLGDRHAARVSASLLHAVDAGDLVAADLGGYVNTAVDLARNLERRSKFHATLRERMERGPLCDGKRFAAEFERAMREIARG